MDLKDIKELIALIRKNDLSEFSLEQEGFKITLKRGAEFPHLGALPTPLVQAQVPSPGHFALSSQPPVQNTPVSQAGNEAAGGGRELPSPMVGTFYSSPSPDAAPFVSVGQQITPDTVVCIIEAMKVMNEIKSEISGTVIEVVAENGKPVQYGQPLFRVR